MARLHDMIPQHRERVIADIVSALADRRDVSFAVVFGSFLEDRPFRDVDLGIWTAEGADRRVDLDLSLTLSRRIGLPVDVRRVNDAPVPFLFHALRGRVVAARDEERLASVMEDTARAYHDRAPLLRRATREAYAS